MLIRKCLECGKDCKMIPATYLIAIKCVGCGKVYTPEEYAHEKRYIRLNTIDKTV